MKYTLNVSSVLWHKVGGAKVSVIIRNSQFEHAVKMLNRITQGQHPH